MWHSCRGEGRENARKKTLRCGWERPTCTVKNVFLFNCPLWENLTRICSLRYIVFAINENIPVTYDLVFRLKCLKSVLILRASGFIVLNSRDQFYCKPHVAHQIRLRVILFSGLEYRADKFFWRIFSFAFFFLLALWSLRCSGHSAKVTSLSTHVIKSELFFSHYFISCPQFTLCQRTLGSNPAMLQNLHWRSGVIATELPQ